jgi:cell wall-associated NlpC family hydrolase
MTSFKIMDSIFIMPFRINNFFTISPLQVRLLYRKLALMKYLLALLVLLQLSACGTTPPHTTVQPAVRTAKHTTAHAAPRRDEAQMNNLAIYAMSLYDTPYQYGGKTRVNGFDCSGFVQFVFQNSLGLQLPRTSSEMSQLGAPLEAVQLQPGDLVFFDTTGSPYSHVGIFVGENRFVHSPRTGKAIMLTSLNDKYWRAHYIGARRIGLNQKLAINN